MTGVTRREVCRLNNLVINSCSYHLIRILLLLSDDLDISPDFFDYFLATYPVLHADPSLWCVSAWNDNGKAELVSDEPGMSF